MSSEEGNPASFQTEHLQCREEQFLPVGLGNVNPDDLQLIAVLFVQRGEGVFDHIVAVSAAGGIKEYSMDNRICILRLDRGGEQADKDKNT
jgi:hypothetical protein